MTGTGTSANWKFQSATIEKNATIDEKLDPSTGAYDGCIVYNKQQTLEATVKPSGSTLALAKNANIVPAIMAAVAVTDADKPSSSDQVEGTYYVRSARAVKSATGDTEISMSLFVPLNDDESKMTLSLIAAS